MKMCGIFAVSGENTSAGKAVLSGLKKLEYRGYDSWGIGIKLISGGILITKEVGKISKVNQSFQESTEAIGHSRWATHGRVTKENAHPHQAGRVVLVHNGIFENYEKEKILCKKNGFRFVSETDSEVIAEMINKALGTGGISQVNIEEAIAKVTKKIIGRFAILIMVEGVSGIFAARRGSPLIIGRGIDKTFIASDIPAFLEQTNIVNYCDDGEMIFVKGSHVEFKNLETLEIIKKRDIEVSWKVEEAKKGDFPHFMIKEIFDQKETIVRAIDHKDSEINKAIKLLKDVNGVYFVACGTANKVAMAAEYFFADISGRKINVVPASEMAYFEKFINKKTAVIAISQSGETADVLEVLECAKKVGAKILSLTNIESSSIARLSDVNLPINAGPEKAVASTKAATAQMTLCFLLAYADAGRLNVGRQILNATAGNINDLLNPRYEKKIREIAMKNFSLDKIFIIGRGAMHPMALEAAIKIQEVSYMSAFGFAAGELKHGPIALIEMRTPCIILGDDSETISNATELKARGAMIIGVSPNNNPIFDKWLRVPDCNGAQPIASIIPVQILAYHLAILRNLNPDMPRNLAKSVTVK